MPITVATQGAQEAMLVCDVGGSDEHVVGTSYSNPANARCAMAMCTYLFKHLPDIATNVLIITAYSAQRDLVQQYIVEHTDQRVRDQVTVRTIDDSPSHEENIVIVDFVRTLKVGFINCPKRMAVATTRARYFSIYLTHFKCKLIAGSQLGALIAYAADRHCTLELAHFDRLCATCGSRRHGTEDCSPNRQIWQSTHEDDPFQTRPKPKAEAEQAQDEASPSNNADAEWKRANRRKRAPKPGSFASGEKKNRIRGKGAGGRPDEAVEQMVRYRKGQTEPDRKLEHEPETEPDDNTQNDAPAPWGTGDDGGVVLGSTDDHAPADVGQDAGDDWAVQDQGVGNGDNNHTPEKVEW